MKRIFLTASVLFFALMHVAFAQQDPKFTHYMFNQVVYNPAFIGAEMGDNFCINLVRRDQWLGYTDPDDATAPLTSTFNIHRPFKLQNGNKIGVGLIFTDDGLGFQNTTTAYGGFSYHYQLSKSASGGKRYLIGGLNLGMIQSGIDGNKLRPIDLGDGLIDAIITDGKSAALDFGLGLLYKTDDFYVGFSNMHIPQSDVDWFGTLTTAESKWNRHFYINAGYEYALTDNLVLKPRALLKWDRAIWQVDLGVLAEFNQLLWAGLNVRRAEGMMILAGANIMNTKKSALKVGISYDITFSELQSISNGSLEFMANYCFPITFKPKPPKPEQDVRFLGGYTL